MAECIEREVVMQKFADHVKRSNNSDFAPVPTWNQAVQIVEDCPAADVRPVVRGKWIPDYDYTEYDIDGSTLLLEPRKFQDGWQCSLCGGYTPSETNFCHHCGADMR